MGTDLFVRTLPRFTARENSSTETYAALEFYIDNWRWAGVPSFVRTGKRLARRMTEISVHFKRTPQALFARTPGEEIDPNVITLFSLMKAFQ